MLPRRERAATAAAGLKAACSGRVYQARLKKEDRASILDFLARSTAALLISTKQGHHLNLGDRRVCDSHMRCQADYL
eukprot:357713-Chlamydomonas_euryale.AAC.7